MVHKPTPVAHTLFAIQRNDGQPLLPVMSDDVEAFRDSPLFPYMETDEPQTSSLLGPGPWVLQCNLEMSPRHRNLHRTHTNEMSNVSVTHAR